MAVTILVIYRQSTMYEVYIKFTSGLIRIPNIFSTESWIL